MITNFNQYYKIIAYYSKLIAFYSIAVMIALIAFHTFYSGLTPIINTTHSITQLGKMDFLISCKSTVTIPTAGMVVRVAEHQSQNFKYNFPAVFKQFNEGKRQCTEIIMMPEFSPKGDYLLSTYLVWQPTFSLKQHHFLIYSLPFSKK